MNLTIGNKSLKDISQEELLDIVVIEGCCPVITDNIWNIPVITDFSNTLFSNTVVLDYVAYRVSDNMKSAEFTFFFNTEDYTFHYTRDYAYNKQQSNNYNRFSIEKMRYLISKGYHIPLY